MDNTQKTAAGSIGAILIAVGSYCTSLNNDVVVLKHQVETHHVTLMSINKELVDVSRTNTELLHKMDKRLTLLEEKSTRR